jgi:crotonobetaine/carnitine-CoA ligase
VLGFDVRRMTTGQIVADKAARNGDKVFLTYTPDGRTYTYNQVHGISNRVGNGLLRHGIAHGEKVGVLLENCPEQVLLYCGLGKIGAVAAPVNTAARGLLLQYFLDHSDSVALVTSFDLLDRFVPVRGDLPKIRHVWLVSPTADELAQAKQMLAPLPVHDFAAFASEPDTVPAVEVSFRDPAFIFYTSGTTGPSKGILYTHAKTWQGVLGNMETYGHRETDVIYVCLPMFHTGAMLISVFLAFMADASVVVSRRFSASRYWDDVRACGATAIHLMGSMVNFLWSQPESPRDRDNRVRICLSNPVPKFAVAFEERFGLRFVSGYGLSDFGPVAAYTLNDPVSKLGCAGRPRRGYEIRVVDDDDYDVPPGQVGEIVLRSHLLWDTASGYYKNPEATLQAWRNWWFHTGDRGRMDADGYLWFVDRKKDAMRRRGENVSAFEVEQVILRHPAVADAAVFPVAASTSEDEVAVAVTLKPGETLDAVALVEHCRHNLAYFMVPRYVRFFDDLPRTLSQKVEKYKLRQQAEAALDTWWDREAAGITLQR